MNFAGTTRYLDRRMLENYLLHPAAITSTLWELGLTADSEAVASLILNNCEASDISELDAAAVLTAVFSELSESTLEFRKTRDVPTLVAWILENDPEYLAPLRLCLRNAFGI